MNAVLSWSGGKECAMALYEARRAGVHTISALLTTITEGYDRVSMHGVRRSLIEKQAEAVGLLLITITIPKNCSHHDYASIMRKEMEKLGKEGVSSVIFGDVFLEDLRRYRDENLLKIGMGAVFPLWKRNTRELARQFIELGFKAVVTCIDSKVLEERFLGRTIDADFLNELPGSIDPCGENGEYHSFVYDGPIFRENIPFSVGEKVLRNSFYFCDLLSE